jgi:nitrogen fixation/metabolism regulation signal transduction histidine kinase
MRPTIKNKLGAGFTALLLLMGIVAAIGIYSVVGLRRSALETARVGDRLNAISLEIQVHNLAAQRKVKDYLLEFKKLGPEEARQEYLDEAEFEVHEIYAVVANAVKLAPTDEKRAKFQIIADAAKNFSTTLEAVVQGVEQGIEGEVFATSVAAYQAAAERLSESAEDGEMAGREASEASQGDIERISRRTVPLVIGVSLAGLFFGLTMSLMLARAILLPVKHLTEVAENVSLGNLTMPVRRFSNDEIGDLADSFSRMVTAVRFFQSEAEASKAQPVPEMVRS